MDKILEKMVTKTNMEDFTVTIEGRLDKIEGKQEAQAKSQAELHVRFKKAGK